MKTLLTCLSVILVLAPAVEAVSPSTELFLPSVGRGQGACPGGVCSLWRTDVWVFNPDASATATVELAFLRRNVANDNPQTVEVEVGPGVTLELADVMAEQFGLDGVFGALRFSSSRDVVVTGRIYDANVQTNVGAGTAGQFFAALPAHLALAQGETTDLIGLARDAGGVWRTNFGFVETTGQPAQVLVELIDGSGAVLSSTSYAFNGYGTGQASIADIGGAAGENQRVRATVTSGPGRLLSFASRIDNRTGDPSTVEMVTTQANRSVGSFEGVVMTPDGLRIDGGIELIFVASGLTEYAGITGIPCGDQWFTVDFDTPPIPAVSVEGDGSFSTVFEVSYTEGGVSVFTIEWTLNGVMQADGVASGTLQSVTSNGLGAWAACDGTAVRPWRAGWVAP